MVLWRSTLWWREYWWIVQVQRASSGISSGKARDSNAFWVGIFFLAARGTQIDPSMNSYFDGENDEPLRFWGIVPYFQRNPGDCNMCSVEEVGLWRRQLQPLPPRRPLMGCWISTGFLWTGWFRIWLCHLLPSLGTFKDVGHWDTGRPLASLSWAWAARSDGPWIQRCGLEELVSTERGRGQHFRYKGLNDSQLCTREICVWQSRDFEGLDAVDATWVGSKLRIPPKMIYDMIYIGWRYDTTRVLLQLMIYDNYICLLEHGRMIYYPT